MQHVMVAMAAATTPPEEGARIQPLTVLFVDDDSGDVELERPAMRRDFRVDGTRIETGTDFIDALNSGGFDVILCDYSMPRFSGMEALSLWQAAGAQVPFIFVTGRLSEEVAVECIKAGATDYVLKGNLARLAAAVQRALREFAVARALRQVEVERARVMAAVEQTAEAVLILDAARQVVYVNPAFSGITGYSAEEMLGRDAFMLVHPTDGDVGANQLPGLVQRGESWHGQLRAMRKDGTRYDAEMTLAPVFDGDRKIVNYCAIHRDVSERAAAERRLRELYARLAETDRLKDEFLAAFSHELRTPMNIIMGFAEMLAEGLGSRIDPESQRCVETIIRSAEHLHRLISETLDLARLRIDAVEPRFAPTDVRVLVCEVVDEFKALAAEKRLALECTVPSTALQATTDALRLRQILYNLLDNAIKFTNAGTVSAGAWGDAQRLALEVRDTGIGIAPADVPLIFQDFRQLDGKSTRHFGGCGVGLALTKRLLDLLGGSIEVESQPGHGSCFRVSLPTSPPDAMRRVGASVQLASH